jgi:hypothetical protein
MPSRTYKDTVKFLETHGFEYDRTNSKQVDFYTLNGMEVSLTGSCDERVAREIKRRVQKSLGLATDRDAGKRHADRVKARQASERDRAAREVAKREREIAELLEHRDDILGGIGGLVTDREAARIEQLIEQQERELREWRRLMQGKPRK